MALLFVLVLIALVVAALILGAARRKQARGSVVGGAMPPLVAGIPAFVRRESVPVGLQNLWAEVLDAYIRLRDGPVLGARVWGPALPALQDVERALDAAYDETVLAQHAATDIELLSRTSSLKTLALRAIDTLERLPVRTPPIPLPAGADLDASRLKVKVFALPGWTEGETSRGPKIPRPVTEALKASEVLAAGTFGHENKAPAFVLAHTESELEKLLALYERPDEGGRAVYVVLVDKAGDESLLLEAAGAIVGLRPKTAGAGSPPAATGWLYRMVLVGKSAVRQIISYVSPAGHASPASR